LFPSGVPFEGRQPNSKPRRNEAYKELSLLPHNFIELILIWSNEKEQIDLYCSTVEEHCAYIAVFDMRDLITDYGAITVPGLPFLGYLFIDTCRSVILRVEGV
jgi:hypothetical protein